MKPQDRLSDLAPPFAEQEILLSREDLLGMTKSEKEDAVPVLASLLRAHIEEAEWPLPPLPCSLREAVDSLKRGEVRKASLYLKAVFPSYWAAADGPSSSFLREGILEKVLPYRVGLNSAEECFDITLGEMRRAAEVQRKTVSFFSPGKAFRLYRKYLGAKTEPLVWDPSGGFGGRLLGFVSAYPKGWYFCNEPAKMTYMDLTRLGSYFSRCSVERLGSEKGNPGLEPGSCDLVLTCPPYHDKEKYFDEPGQCWRDYPQIEKWRESYVAPTLSHAHRCLKSAGLLVLVIDNIDLWHRAARDQGFVLLDSAPLAPKRDHFLRASDSSGAKEYLAVWRKRA